MERLTEKRDGQNVIPLRQNGKIKWAICSAGLGDAPTEYLYGDHADRLAAIEDILGDEYDLEKLRLLLENDKSCYTCKNYKGDKICGFKGLDVEINPQEGCSVREAALRREQDEQIKP